MYFLGVLIKVILLQKENEMYLMMQQLSFQIVHFQKVKCLSILIKILKVCKK